MTVGSRPDTDTPERTVDSRLDAEALEKARIDTVLLVSLGERHYGLPIAAVERVLPMAYVMALPDGGERVSEGFSGMLNLHGQVLPVLDPRPHLGLPNSAPAAEHRFVLLNGAGRFLLWVDSVDEVVTFGPDSLIDVPPQHASPLVRCVLRLGETIVPVLEPAAFETRKGLS
jgi:chemotaxis signal transduction protein